MLNATALQALFDAIPKELVPATDCEIRQNGKVLFRYQQGYSDYENTRPASSNDIYWLYSCTKVVTAVAAMRLVEKGLLHLDDPVEKYIPEYANLTVLANPTGGIYDPVKAAFVGGNAETSQAAAPAKNKMRVKDLLCMSSGLSYDMTLPLIQKMRKNPELNVLDFAKMLAAVPLKFEPGTDFLYSFSHDVLGAVIEAVTKTTISEYLQAEIFDPLGMGRTGFTPKEDEKYHLCAQYMMNDDGKTYHSIGAENEFRFNDSFCSGGAGLSSTLDDMMIFCDVLANGGTSKDGYCLLKQETIDLMRQNHLTDSQRASFLSAWGNLKNYSYGLGVRTFIENYDGCGGEIGEFGWEGAAGSLLLIDPNNHISCVYTQHVRKSNYAFSQIHRKIIRAIYENL